MDEQITLNPGETVIKNSPEIGYGGSLSRDNSELILTNQSIILKRRNLFGKVTEIKRFPLSDITVSNNQAQVRLGKKDIVTPTLDIYFTTGRESFRFTWEDDVKEWANEINRLVTGQQDIYEIKDWAEDMEHIASAIDGSIRKVKRAFGIKETEVVSCKCPACGASISGILGETVQCPYCGSYHTFE